MTAAVDLALIDRLTGGRVGTHDVSCPLCGPTRRSPINQRRRVLRVWRLESGFATFACARCGTQGHTRDPHARQPDPEVVAQARAEAADRERVSAAERLNKARWIWSQRR